MNLHQAVTTGFTDGKCYDTYRPSYADELVNQVVTSLHTSSTSSPGVQYDVLELGAGTGKFTRKLAPLLFAKGFRFLATEPMENFLDTLKEQSPNVETKLCPASHIPLPDSSVQNIVCAQCIHWFANKESYDEMRRVLVPGGRLFVVYNVKEWQSNVWMAEMKAILDTYTTDVPKADEKEWQRLLESDVGFAVVEDITLPRLALQADKTSFVNTILSISAVSALDEAEKSRARSRFHEVLDKHFPGEGHSINIPLHSEFYCTQRV